MGSYSGVNTFHDSRIHMLPGVPEADEAANNHVIKTIVNNLVVAVGAPDRLLHAKENGLGDEVAMWHATFVSDMLRGMVAHGMVAIGFRGIEGIGGKLNQLRVLKPGIDCELGYRLVAYEVDAKTADGADVVVTSYRVVYVSVVKDRFSPAWNWVPSVYVHVWSEYEPNPHMMPEFAVGGTPCLSVNSPIVHAKPLIDKVDVTDTATIQNTHDNGNAPEGFVRGTVPVARPSTAALGGRAPNPEVQSVDELREAVDTTLGQAAARACIEQYDAAFRPKRVRDDPDCDIGGGKRRRCIQDVLDARQAARVLVLPMGTTHIGGRVPAPDAFVKTIEQIEDQLRDLLFGIDRRVRTRLSSDADNAKSKETEARTHLRRMINVAMAQYSWNAGDTPKQTLQFVWPGDAVAEPGPPTESQV